MNRAPITLLHFTNTGVRAGVEEHILVLLRGLGRKHFRLLLVCRPELAAKYGSDLPDDVQLIPLRLHKPTAIAAAFRFARVLRKNKVDILHSHMFQSSRLASPIGRVSGVPLIVETPHVREQWRRGWFKGSYAIDRLVGRFVDHYIAVSEANARYLVEEKGLPKEKIRVIYNGCDLNRLDAHRPVPREMKRALGFGDGDPVLVVLGRLEPQKGHQVLLDALPAVRREFPTVRLVCVGDGRLRQQLERHTRDLQLEDAVRFVGFQSNVADWLALADLSVLPSFYEGLPLVAVESLASERPIVATAVDGTKEVVVNEKTGLTAPPGDPEPLASAILRLLRQPKLAKELARAGRQWVLERFSQERQIQLTQEFYLEMWQGHLKKKRAEPSGVPAEDRAWPQLPVTGKNEVNLKTEMMTHPMIGALHPSPTQELCGPNAPTAAICSEVTRQCAKAFGVSLRAVVLTGSLARDEASFATEGTGWKLLGDAEFLLVFHPQAALPSASEIDSARQRIEHNLLSSKLECQIDLNAVHPKYLRRLPPHIFTYELRTCGKVIWGEKQILSVIPAFSSTEIRLEDAWRLLCNRMIELLETAPDLDDDGRKHALGPLYRAAKLYLDAATSFLVFAHRYGPSYRERARSLRLLAEDATRLGEWPFELARFAEQVTSCTEWKLAAKHSGSQPLPISRQEAITFARALWRWELERLTGSRREQLSDRELLLHWMQLQPPVRRLHGWLYVARKCGWQRSWRHWPRWARGAWRASPRHWVYAAAAELLFRLPGRLSPAAQPSAKDDNLQELESWLPLLSEPRCGDGLAPWQQLAKEIGWNYHQFLEKTRA